MDRVVIGMSGGVDSAVSAYILKEQGYEVIGVFMKNWDEDSEDCPAVQDFEDVRSVCDRINIPYYTVNFQEEYWDRVFEHFLAEYRAGRTPNPDVLCNKEIKFEEFLVFTKKCGARYLATGHYARVERDGNLVHLKKAIDGSKDQTYFLCMLSQYQLKDVMFPIGDLEKTEVREIAERENLSVARKKDSTGICFIGERKFRQFLKTYIPATPGEIRTLSGEYIKEHEGLMYYTLGQRRGLDIGGRGNGQRWFVVKKDLENNILYVEQGEDSPALYSQGLFMSSFNFISKVPEGNSFECMAKTRYRQPDQKAFVTKREDGWIVDFEERQRAVTPGQYCVLYDGDICLGGGVIEQSFGVE